MVTIRGAELADLEALLALYVQLSAANAQTDVAQARRGLEATLAQSSVSLLVAERDGAVIGTLTLVIVPNITHNGAPWAQVENMVVDAAERRLGIGDRLLAAARDEAWTQGCYKMQLQSADHREGAHRFYSRFGFEPSSVGFRLYRA